MNFTRAAVGVAVAGLAFVLSAETQADSSRKVVSFEPISVDAQWPGAEPFHGAQEIRLEVSPAYTGPATLVLSTESTGSAQHGRRVECRGEAVNGNVRFAVGQSWTQQYEFMEVKGDCELRAVRAEGTFLQAKAEAMRLEVDTKNDLHLCRGPEERPELLVRNPCGEPLAWKTVFVLTDVFGRKVEIPFARRVAAGETVRVPVPWPLPAKGVWYVRAQVADEDGQVAEKTTCFACIDRHEVTPCVDKPKFRFGIHYHGTKYWPDKIDRTIAALVAAGAKFTRCDYSHMWSDIELRPGTYDWTKADAMVDRLRAAGLALDIIIYSPPFFAIDPESLAKADSWRKRGLRVRGSCMKIKPGLFRDFCRKYASRYGRRIDYYEIGNEWDLSGAETFPHEDALAIQREGYEGLHQGCADVCVTPNGWAYPCTEVEATPNRWNLGIIEFFADHPEVYDCWALHGHGSFAKYVNHLSYWSALRERTKVKTRGWISNESAHSTAFGNEIPASRDVWEKPLYAWSRGCRDYIWYNLRATGWFDGSEPGYGLISADFHPRATYAAFAALTAIFQNLDYDGAFYSHRLRHLLRFRGSSQALPEGGLVIAGWDDGATGGETRRIRLRTDATKAELSDYMGNRTPVAVTDGVVEFPMILSPQALLLPGASRAEAVEPKELSRSLSGPKRIDLSNPNRAPDFRLADKAHYHSFYEANPPFAHRIWTGPDDLSAEAWFVRKGERLSLRVEVRDDRLAPGDRAEAVVETPDGQRRTVSLKPGERRGVVRPFEADLPVSGGAFGIDVRVHDDDGEGEDGYLMLCRDGEDPFAVEVTASH